MITLNTVIIVALIWLLLTYPMVKEVIKQMEAKGHEVKNDFLFGVFAIFECVPYLPQYYFLVVKETIQKYFKKKQK